MLGTSTQNFAEVLSVLLSSQWSSSVPATFVKRISEKSEFISESYVTLTNT